MSETRLVGDVLAYLSTVPGCFAWRNNTGAARVAGGRFMRFGEPGAPDIIACHRGRFVGIECKVGRGKQSPLQQRWQARLEAAGGIYLLAYELGVVVHVIS